LITDTHTRTGITSSTLNCIDGMRGIGIRIAASQRRSGFSTIRTLSRHPRCAIWSVNRSGLLCFSSGDDRHYLSTSNQSTCHRPVSRNAYLYLLVTCNHWLTVTALRTEHTCLRTFQSHLISHRGEFDDYSSNLSSKQCLRQY